jgi:TP901 family phage tail tape measure protein
VSAVAPSGIAFSRALSIFLGMRAEGFNAGIISAEQKVSMFRARLLVLGLTTGVIVGKMVRDFSKFEDATVRAAVANERGTAALRHMRDTAFTLSRRLKESPIAMAELTKQIQFFGIRSPTAIRHLSEFSLRLSQISGESPEEAAKVMFRLLQLTKKEGEGLDEIAMKADRAAAAIFRVGRLTTAGPGELLQFLQTFQVAGVAADFEPEDLIALAGAIADIVPQMRSITTTATIRALQSENFAAFAQVLGVTVEQVREMRKNDPAVFIQRLGEALQTAASKQELLSVMRQLGIGGLREAKSILALTSNVGKLDDLIAAARDTTGSFNEFMRASEAVLRTLSAQWRGFTASLERFGITVATFVAPALKVILGLLTSLVNILNDHPILAALVTGAVGIKTGGALGRAFVGSRIGGRIADVATGALLFGGRGGGGAIRGLRGRGIAGLLGLLSAPFRSPTAGMSARSANRFMFVTRANQARFGAGIAAGELPGFGPRRARVVGEATRLGLLAGGSSRATAGLGSMMGRGAGFFGGGAGAVAKLTGAAALRAIPVVGQILTVLMLLRPLTDLFGNLAGSLRDLGDAVGGPIGFILKSIAFVFKAIQIAGEGVLFVLNKVWSFFKSILSFIGDKTGLSKVFGAISSGLDKTLDGMDSLVRKIRGEEERSDSPTFGAGGINQTNNFNINVSNPDQLRAHLMDVARAAGGLHSTNPQVVSVSG